MKVLVLTFEAKETHLTLQFSDAWSFCERFATVKIVGKWGYIDMTKKFIELKNENSLVQKVKKVEEEISPIVYAPYDIRTFPFIKVPRDALINIDAIDDNDDGVRNSTEEALKKLLGLDRRKCRHDIVPIL
jgi:hypothetical protein